MIFKLKNKSMHSILYMLFLSYHTYLLYLFFPKTMLFLFRLIYIYFFKYFTNIVNKHGINRQCNQFCQPKWRSKQESENLLAMHRNTHRQIKCQPGNESNEQSLAADAD